MKKLNLLILGLLANVSVGSATITNPGWYSAAGQNNKTPITIGNTAQTLVAGTESLQTFPSIAETITPDIQALADGLQDNPVKIFNYVHDHIRHVLYFGSKKGAELTLLEKSGNDFDQCALLVALLRAAGYSPTYQFGLAKIPYDAADGTHNDVHHWLQLSLVNTNWTSTMNYLNYLTATRGYPFVANYGNGNTVGIQHVWVSLTIGSNTYQLDPAFKISEPIAGMANLASAINISSNALMTAAGGTDTGTYASNLNESNVRGLLTDYSTNLVNYLQSNAPNASVQEVLGGWRIVPSTNTVLSQNLLFPIDTHTMQTIEWSNEPTNYMATFEIDFAHTNYQWYVPQFEGQRLALVYTTNGIAQLWQDDALLVTNTTTTSDTNVTCIINFPFGSWDFTNNKLVVDTNNFANATVTTTYQRTNASYVITYAYEPDWGWLQKRERQLDAYLQAGLAPTSRQVVCETLNVMQLTWMLETESVEQMVAAQYGTLPQYHSRFGRMAQANGNGYYIDVYMQLSGGLNNSGIDTSSLNHQFAAFDVLTYFESALEHGMIEQLQSSNLVAASTVKMLEIAVTNGQSIYLASNANWSSVQTQLVNYNAATLNMLYSQYIAQGYYLLLPQNGLNNVSGPGSWAGYGAMGHYQDTLNVAMPMIINGGFNGGFAELKQAVADYEATHTIGDAQPDLFDAASPFLPGVLGADPVDMVNGTFLVGHTDLSLGKAEPRGISLSRYYNGTRRNSDPAGMGAGWVNNYCVKALKASAPQAGLGNTTPQQMAPLLTATLAAAALHSATPDPKNWTVMALIAKWGIDQLNKNGVSVNLGKDTVQFVKQPDGTFTPPANCTMSLIQTNGVYWLQQRHGNTFKFNNAGLLTNIVDQYNQSLNLTYNASNWVQTVTDWKNRQFTFNYSGTPSRLTSVTDGSRTVHYGYSSAYNLQGDLTSFTDAEGKTSTYQYDDSHDITASIDAASRLVVSNLYDSFGHVAIQYTEGVTNKTWHIFWSGWQTIAEDPAGGQQVYNYDDQSRVIGSEDALGHLTQTAYDGQNHVVMTISPLNETNQFIYDGQNNLTNSIERLGYTNQFFYDSQNRLYRSEDALGHPTTYGYNAQFSLTGQTNGAGDWATYAYNTDGTLHTKADAGGITTYDSYDSYGQLTHVIFPGGLGGESFINDSLGDVTSHTDARGFSTTFQYNSRRQLTNTIAPTNLTTSVSFDAIGNVATTTDARGNVTSNTWSATRHLLATTMPSTPQGAPVVTNGYDSRDWLTKTVDPLQHSTLYTNDLAGQAVSVTDPLQRTTRFGFDADGRKLYSANAGNETNSQTWDARGKMIKSVDGAGHYSLRAYDAAGNQIILTNRNGKKWQFQFDAANRLTNTITPLGRTMSRTFNQQGLVSTAKDPANHSTTFNYDAKGRLTNRTDNVGTTLYGYDANDNRTNVTENGQTNSWTYDAYNRVSSYKDVYGNLIQYRYDANGNVTNLVYPGNKTSITLTTA